MARRFVLAVAVSSLLVLSGALNAAADPPKYDPNEPLATTLSLEKSADYLDTIAAFWMQKSEAAPKGSYRQQLHSCGSCHANFAYSMARPLLLKQKPQSLLAQTRQWMEQQGDSLDCSKSPHRQDGAGKYHFPGAGPTIATGLVFHDLHTGEGLRPATRKALNKMWAVRQTKPTRSGYQFGHWCVDGFCWDLSAPELDMHYSVALAAIAAGAAPDGYARSEEAKGEIARFRQDFGKAFGAERLDLHAQALALWASCRLDGLLDATKREAIVRSLLAAQCPDGGWSLAKLGGRWHGGDKEKADGYATGLVVYVLRQAGLSPKRPEMARGIAWLKTHQRASGCWFTPNADRSGTVGGIGSHDLAILNLGTAYAVMALHACENTAEPRTDKIPGPAKAP